MQRFPAYQTPFANGAQAREFSARYMLDSDGDRIALEAGRRILRGDFSDENVKDIYRWKLESFSAWLPWVNVFPRPNTPEKLRLALQSSVDAIGHEGARVAISALKTLKNVGIPVASAVITAIHPERFTVIDRRAYRALGVSFPKYLSIGEYLHYLTHCEKESARLCMSLRDFDRALWQFGGKKIASFYACS